MTAQVHWLVTGGLGPVIGGDKHAIWGGGAVIGWVIGLGGQVMSGVCPGRRRAGAFRHLIVRASAYILYL